MLAHAIALARQ